MPAADEAIRQSIKSMPEATILTPADLPGDRRQNQTVMDQMVANCELMETDTATYITPVLRKKSGKPSIWDTFNAYAEQSDEIITCTPGTAANSLGLMNQCPMGEARYTSGRTRQIVMGGIVYDMIHVPAWKLLLGDTIPGLAIRYFAWGDTPSRAPKAAERLTKVLNPEDWGAIDQVSDQLPDCVRQAIKEARHI